jgi:hypothetical protein
MYRQPALDTTLDEWVQQLRHRRLAGQGAVPGVLLVTPLLQVGVLTVQLTEALLQEVRQPELWQVLLLCGVPCASY